jgi:hypothetical protein
MPSCARAGTAAHAEAASANIPITILIGVLFIDSAEEFFFARTLNEPRKLTLADANETCALTLSRNQRVESEYDWGGWVVTHFGLGSMTTGRDSSRKDSSLRSE